MINGENDKSNFHFLYESLKGKNKMIFVIRKKKYGF